MEKKIVLGILAHVDAGKTTLSESMLYKSGSIRRQGRVDHKDAFLDTYDLERERGITIFSKQAVFTIGETEVTLLDTPGHVDFSAEMERTLRVLDYAVLVVNGADGVQGHTQTLWKLLKRYQIPVFLFINKMDQDGTDRQVLLEELKERFGSECIDFELRSQDRAAFEEQLAVCDEAVLEQYLEEDHIAEDVIIQMIAERKTFPCYFGSALLNEGVDTFMQDIERYTVMPESIEDFGARVYKIGRDTQGNRLTYMKITDGVLRVKDLVDGEDKADQIRIYSGAKYETVGEAGVGTVCAVTGLASTYAGQGLGVEKESQLPVLEPVLTYRIALPEGVDAHTMLSKLAILEEEEPQLHIVWNERLGEIHAQVMGEVQIEVLQRLIQERFDIAVTFDAGNITYKETIANPVEGVGHYEPLKHYAEVHLLLEPGEMGSGLTFASEVSEDVLDLNWQRLILTHLQEREHPGVLTGSAITDMKMTLIAGRAHIKHTVGGDFRQATYRAIRHGLKKAESVLLEPWYEFQLELPTDAVGRAMSDIQKMEGTFELPVTEGDRTVLTGSAPVAEMRDYQREVVAYTKGLGKLSCSLQGYKPCHNSEQVIEALGYDSEADLENPTGSVFCSHGAGNLVPWDQVEEHMHIESAWKPQEEIQKEQTVKHQTWADTSGYGQEDKELNEIFERTYGPVKRDKLQQGWKKTSTSPRTVKASDYKAGKRKKEEPQEEYLLVDGYNTIFAWDELKELAEVNMKSARDKLMDIMSNYQGYHKMTLILVFDAYKVKDNPGTVYKYHNIHVVFTKEAETADQYIEKVAHKMAGRHRVTVATSDAVEQVIIMGQGAYRLSSRDLLEEVKRTRQEIQNEHMGISMGARSYLLDHVSEEIQEYVDEVHEGEN